MPLCLREGQKKNFGILEYILFPQKYKKKQKKHGISHNNHFGRHFFIQFFGGEPFPAWIKFEGSLKF